MNVIEYYERALQSKGYSADAAQQQAIQRLQVYYDQWLLFKDKRSNRLKKLINRPDVPRGVYMWGGVGRGKSFLMDSFYNTVPVVRKTRIHFHEFMRSVHSELQKIHQEEDPLDIVACTIADKYRLICFDEFHVSDIADAMILYRLLLKLFEYGCSFVMTSNYEPKTLYPDGLHRDRILPAIRLIEERMDVLNVDTGVDYRMRTLEQLQLFYTPISADTQKQLQKVFESLTTRAEENTLLTVENRQIRALAVGGAVVWFDFQMLCGGPRSQNDYLELANRYQTIILSDIPKLEPQDASEARRFTWLIDVLYDHNVKLIMSSAVPAAMIYVAGIQASEFHRTVSRMVEMQSREYMEKPHRHSVKL